jgi:hypothetical protein
MGEWRKGKDCWVLAVVLGCLVLLILAPSALAVETTGQIAGTVTKTGGVDAIEGVEVCAFATSGGLEESAGKHCTTTGAGGDYTISELPSGEYYVEFAVPGSSLDYVTQYYNNKSSPTTAEPVQVLEGGTTKAINAKLQEGGRIEGTVTEFAESEHMPLQNIEVSAYEVGGSKLPVGHAKTNASGQYTIAVLAPGSYEVEFSPTPESGLNFVTQYYKNKSLRAKAEPVEVTEGKTTEEINAALRVGGEISGTVTDAWTHTPVAKVYVVAVGLGGGFAGVAYTNASGEYTIPGLATGEYKITFVGLFYIVQYYNDQSSMTSADPVTVYQGSTTPGIDAALVRKAPVNTAEPIVSGTPAVGQTLSCSTGAWTGEPTPTYTYVWLRNGATITGANGSTYGVQAADQGTGLACKVTATNENGSGSASSNTLMVPVVPPPSVPRPEVKLLSARILVSGDSARVSISCAKAACTGAIELTERIGIVVRHRHHGRTRSRRETVVLGRGVYALSAGHNATISIRLTRAGRKALARARHHRLPVTARVSVTGGTAIRGPVTLNEPLHRRKRTARAGSYSV